MKKAVLILIMITLVTPSFARTIFVRANGRGRFSTIQQAIDHSRDGDTIVLFPGTYKGSGNYNLDFRGKAITVRSVHPNNDACMRNTIIDANGVGVIARFINDEGPETVFEGFTLRAGDVSKDLRGDPGFFEFSMKARPTTRRLRNDPRNRLHLRELEKRVDLNYICDSDFPPKGRIWNGHNPFLQPAKTTNYHGSGDVVLDGQITSDDLSMMQSIIAGSEPANIRADLNGDGLINSSDVTLMTQALSGGTLPAWWNQLTTRAQRNEWINKIRVLDKTDEHIYTSSFFVCHHFAYQTCIHGSFERDDFAVESTEFDGGQTIYNLPMHHVSVSYPTNHAINAVLVGDNPLNFNDWRFLEPQTDTDVVPGQWNMRYGSTVWVGNIYNVMGAMVTYYVDSNGIVMQDYSEDLVLTRSTPPVVEYDNRKDLWHPVIVPNETNGLLFFEKMREDMTRTTDIHVSIVTAADFEEAEALTNRFHFSRILDITTGPDGAIHVLFESKSSGDLQNLFHGIYDPDLETFGDVSQVAPGLRLPAMGRIEVTPAGEIFVFWSENYGYSGSYERGIHWTKSNGSGWDSPQLLTENIFQQQTGGFVNRQFAWYVFDTEVMNDGRLMLVYIEKDTVNSYTFLSYYIYDGTWTSTVIENTGWYDSVQGVDIDKGADGKIHLAYWRGDEPDICYSEGEEPEDGRGNVYYRSFDGLSWSEPAAVDTSDKASCARITASSDGRVYMVWERRVGKRVFPFWSIYDDDWANPIFLDIRPDANAWYPTVEEYADGHILAAWSSRCDNLVTIETAELEYVEKVLYVDAEATGNGDGMSWANAYNYLQDALDYAGLYGGIDEIRVAAGIYRPDRDASHPLGTGDPNSTFQLINKLALKGGYAGVGQPDPNVRDIELYETILSGDLLGNDAPVTDACDMQDDSTRFDNAHNVLTGSGTNVTAVIDGFNVTGGYADLLDWPDLITCCGGGMRNESGSPTVRNCSFIKNFAFVFGAAMFNFTGSPNVTDCMFAMNFLGPYNQGNAGGAAMANIQESPVLSNCTFVDNKSCERGAAMYNYWTEVQLRNCVFSENSNFGGFSCGGAMYNCGGKVFLDNCLFSENMSKDDSGGAITNDYECEAVLNNCTFVGNHAKALGGGIFNESEVNIVSLTNCIFWANSDMGGTDESAQIESETEDLVINYSCVKGWTGIFGGVGNIGSDPKFVAGLLGDYYLSQIAAGQVINSPCVDTGSDSAGNLGLDTATTRTDSVADTGIVDMGYHYQRLVSPVVESWETGATHGGSIGEIWCEVSDGYVEPRTCGIAKLRVCFDTEMDTSVNDISEMISIEGVIGGIQPVAGSVVWDSSTCMIVELLPVLANEDTYTVMLKDAIKSEQGVSIEETSICLTALKGDANSNRSVNSGDLLAVRSHINQPVDCSNARYDINLSGSINSGDLLAARSFIPSNAPVCP